MSLSPERLREALEYDPLTGVFLWRIARQGHTKIGDVAGSNCHRRGYVQIKLDGRPYYAHRLAWLWMTGHWPAEEIDHRDTDTSNNAWSNLREASPRLNKGNLRPRGANLKGTRYEPRGSCWVARIKDHGKNLYLGTFDTQEAAHAAYCAAASRVFGEFARVV